MCLCCLGTGGSNARDVFLCPQTVSTVRLSGKRLLQLINDILDAAKMKQGTLVIKHEKVGNHITRV